MADRKPPIMVPTPDGPKPYGSEEAAAALAPVWGMHPEQVRRIMLLETGELNPDEKFVYDQTQQEQEAQQLDAWAKQGSPPFTAPDPYAPSDPVRDLVRQKLQQGKP